MRIPTIKSLCTIAALVLALAAPAAAQQPSQPVSGGDDQTMLIAGGLTFMNIGDSTGVGVAGNVLINALTASDTGRIGIVFDAGFNSFDGATVTTVMGGGRYTFNTAGKVVPYGQFLLGLSQCCGNTRFAPALGGGLDVAWKPTLNFRGEIQFVFGAVNGLDATRFFLGISTPINKR